MWGLKSVAVRPVPMIAVLFLCALGLCAPSPANAGRLEAGSFTAHDTSTSSGPAFISFQQTFDNIPIVVALLGSNGSDSARIRITNVSTTGFEELILEPDSFDGAHAAETIHYIAVEPGRHVLPDGRIIEAGRNNISAVQHGSGVSGPESWATISYGAAFPNTPSIIANLQTANSETRTVASQSSQPFVTATVNNPTASGFQVALERSETSAGPIPSAETVGWIAFPGNLTGSFPDVSDNIITWSTVNSATNIRGWGNGCFTNGFGQTSASAIVVARKNSHLGGDGGWLRRCSLSSTLIGLTVDEDTSRDTERNHIGESASIIAFSSAFHANLQPALSVTKISLAFDDGLGSNFALPGATLDYRIRMQNDGNAPPDHDSLILTETLPTNISVMINDLGGPGSGPIEYIDGSPASGLSCNFVSFASSSDCYSFSTDGVNFNHSPVDSGDGTDPSITHIRISPTGFMAPDTGSGATSFVLRFKAKID